MNPAFEKTRGKSVYTRYIRGEARAASSCNPRLLPVLLPSVFPTSLEQIVHLHPALPSGTLSFVGMKMFQ